MRSPDRYRCIDRREHLNTAAAFVVEYPAIYSIHSAILYIVFSVYIVQFLFYSFLPRLLFSAFFLSPFFLFARYYTGRDKKYNCAGLKNFLGTSSSAAADLPALSESSATDAVNVSLSEPGKRTI